MMLARLWCWLAGHKIYVLQEFSAFSRRICCKRCPGDWAQNDDVRAVIPWNDEVADIHRRHGHQVLQRTAKRRFE